MLNAETKMNRPDETPLESWKEIAAYLQRNAVTVRRWEKEEGLPVHRHSHKSRSSVYAYPSEIDSWRTSRKVAVEPPPVKRFWRVPAFALTMLACLIMVGNGVRPQAASAQQGPLAKRLVPAKNDIDYYTVSSDGQWLGGTDWKKGDLVLTRVSNGEIRRMTTGTDGGLSWGESPMLSPDQKQVAYWWCCPNSNNGELRVMPNEPGAKSRVLVGSAGEWDGADDAFPIAWSADGKRVLAIPSKRNPPSRSISWVSVADGSVQVLKTFEPWNLRKLAVVRLSPDGHYIAYAAQVRPDAPDTGIYVISADREASAGEPPQELVRGDLNADPIWSPDGRHVLFSSNRSGAFALWSVPVREGKKAGLPSLVRPQTGVISSLGISRSGRYFYKLDAGLKQIFIAEMDPVTGKARGPTASESFVGEDPAWSRDGKWLAFTRPNRSPNNLYTFMIHSMETGAESAMVPNVGHDVPPVWYLNGGVQFNANIHMVSVSSGKPEIVTAPVRLPLGSLSPDDKLLYAGADEGLQVIEVATGERKGMFKVPGGVKSVRMSPDGKTLSIIGDINGTFHLSRIGIDGSDYRELYSGVSSWISATWTRDGRAILFGQQDKNSAVVRIMRIPAEGGQLEFTGISADDLVEFDLSPDGSKIAYTSASSEQQVWAIDDSRSLLK